MKKLLLLAVLLPLVLSCTKKIKQPDVVEKISVPDPIQWPCWNNVWHDRGQVDLYFYDRTDIGFAIENKAYVLRKNSVGVLGIWEYNIFNGSWTQKGPFPGDLRVEATLVVVGTKMYYGLGISWENAVFIPYHDWWEYDPAIDQWTPKANFPAASRTSTTAFAAAGKAYVVGGYDREVSDNYLKQTWQYDPALDTWEQKANLPGGGRNEAAGFGIGNKGYVGTGQGRIMVLNNPVTIYYKDFYEYNALTNTWAQKADYPGATRWEAFSFMIRGNGFIGGGYNAAYGYRELYMYDHLTNAWVQKTDYPGYGTSMSHFGGLIHFSTLDHGFVIEKPHLNRESEVPQHMWRYTKRLYCPPNSFF